MATFLGLFVLGEKKKTEKRKGLILLTFVTDGKVKLFLYYVNIGTTWKTK